MTISLTGTLTLWTNATAKMDLGEIRGAQPSEVRRVFFSDDGRRFCTGGELGSARVWDSESGKELLVIPSKVHLAIFSPDGKRIVLIYSMEPAVQIRDARTGSVLSTWPTGIAWNGAFSRYGKRFLVTISGYDAFFGLAEANAQLWDCESGRRILLLKGHSELFNEILFTADDQRIISSSFDMTVRQWETFPWREAEYPGTAGQPILDRARRVEPLRSRPESRVLFPRRDARATSAQLDLTEHYTYPLQTWSGPWFRIEEADNSLRELGCGLLELGSVQFDVRGVIQLRHHTDFDDAWRRGWEKVSVASIEGVRVEQKVRRLQALHGTYLAAREGAEIARFVWHYDTGEEASPIFYGRDVQDWWWRPEDPVSPTADRSRVVWTGSNPIAREQGYQLWLYLTTIENPRPQEMVRSLDYISAMGDSAPFLVALTVE